MSSYNRVAAFARLWHEQRLVSQLSTGRGTFVPLAFGPGEAFQFDWSEDWAVPAGVRTKLQVARFTVGCALNCSVSLAHPLGSARLTAGRPP